MSENKIIVGISQGDINGIGWEVILKTFADPSIFELCSAVVFGSVKTAAHHKRTLTGEEIQLFQVRDFSQINHKRLNVFSVYEEDVPVEFGKDTPNGGKYALKSLEAACDALEKGQVDVLVTAPINKHAIQSEGFQFAGHTGYLAKRFGRGSSLMMLCSGALRVGLVTEHVPLAQVAQHITSDNILARLRLMHTSLVKDFGLRKPKIAVLGLNPHAGDSGTIGKEEQEAIIPAINQAKEENILAMGPYAADGFFGNEAFSNFDGVLAMYHDQGLAPFKALSFIDGVNFTAGLSIIRTSPDHGTGFDIAGQNKANESSFRNAVYMAIDVFRKRSEYTDLTANPLKVTLQKRESR